MLDFKGLDGFSAGNDGLERGAELGNVPLSVADLIELPPDGMLWRDRECVAEGAVRKTDGQVGLEHEDAFADSLHEIQRVDFAHGSGSCTPSDDRGSSSTANTRSCRRTYFSLLPVLIVNLSRGGVG